MPVSIALIRKLEEVEPRLREVLFAILEEIERQREETVTKKEFNELKEIVKELAEAQKRTEQRVEELAEAQKRTEQRVEELAEAQKRTEERLTRLEKVVEELAEAQKRTEERLTRLEKVVEELAQAQKRTEERVEELAQAQKRTEKELQKLIKEHAKTREQVGGLSITVGYVLENEAMKALPALLEQEFGLKLEGRLVRKFVRDKKGKPIEVNIIGKAVKNGHRVIVIGEAKAQLSKNKVSEFLRKTLKRLEGVFKEEFFPILITHMVTQPDVEEYAVNQGIKRIYYSYEF